MYEQVFHFNSRPFTATPYVKHYFAGDAIHQALAQARLCIDRGSGPVIVIGATGMGKSLMLAMLEEQYQSQFNVINLGCARLDKRSELLQSVLYELQLPFKDLSETELRFSLIDYLKPSEHCPNGILLLVDEANSLSTEMLDEIRLITNLVRDGQPRVRLVMAGNQLLEENLNDAKLESFNQRIAARCYLSNMSREETARYVTEHIDRSGGDGAQLFREDSLRAIHDVSEGCPRLINQVCDHALILAATRGQNEITSECIHEGWADVQSIPGSFNPTSAAPAAVAGLKKDENWTVIEFGQLDEDDALTDHDTEKDPIDELGQSGEGPRDEQSESTPVSSASLEDSMPAIENHDVGQEMESAEASNDWQDAEEKQEEPSLSEVESAADDEEAGLVEHADPSAALEEFEDVQMSSEEQDTGQSELEDETTTDPAGANAAAEMEAQLAAVFEDEPENELEMNAKNADISDLELEQSQIIDQVELERAALFGTEEASENPAPLAEDAGIENEEPSVDSPTNLYLENDLVDDQARLDMESAAEPMTDTQVGDQELSLADANSESLESDLLEADETYAEQDQSEEVEANKPKLRQPVETIDPFDETFAEEESLIDRFAPFVAHQNQSSLTVTSDELAMLTPNDEHEQDEASSPAIFETDHAADDPAKSDSQSFIADENQPLVYEDDDSPVNLSDDADSIGDVPTNQDESVIEPELESDTDDVSDYQLDSEMVSETVSETMGEADSENVVEVNEQVTGQVEATTTQDIQAQAEEILNRLREPKRVSCETPSDEYGSEDSAHVEASIENSGQPGEEETDTLDSNSTPQVELVDSEYVQQSAALDESQQILNEILEQRHALAEQREKLSTDQSDAPGESHSETGEAVSDQEMIIVSRMEQQSETSKVVADTPVPFPPTPVSTGRAERMDYQKLFDQLREISSPKE